MTTPPNPLINQIKEHIDQYWIDWEATPEAERETDQEAIADDLALIIVEGIEFPLVIPNDDMNDVEVGLDEVFDEEGVEVTGTHLRLGLISLIKEIIQRDMAAHAPTDTQVLSEQIVLRLGVHPQWRDDRFFVAEARSPYKPSDLRYVREFVSKLIGRDNWPI